MNKIDLIFWIGFFIIGLVESKLLVKTRKKARETSWNDEELVQEEKKVLGRLSAVRMLGVGVASIVVYLEFMSFANLIIQIVYILSEQAVAGKLFDKGRKYLGRNITERKVIIRTMVAILALCIGMMGGIIDVNIKGLATPWYVMPLYKMFFVCMGLLVWDISKLSLENNSLKGIKYWKALVGEVVINIRLILLSRTIKVIEYVIMMIGIFALSLWPVANIIAIPFLWGMSIFVNRRMLRRQQIIIPTVSILLYNILLIVLAMIPISDPLLFLIGFSALGCLVSIYAIYQIVFLVIVVKNKRILNCKYPQQLLEYETGVVWDIISYEKGCDGNIQCSIKASGVRKEIPLKSTDYRVL